MNVPFERARDLAAEFAELDLAAEFAELKELIGEGVEEWRGRRG